MAFSHSTRLPLLALTLITALALPIAPHRIAAQTSIDVPSPTASLSPTASPTSTTSVTPTVTVTPSETPLYNTGDVGGQIIAELQNAGVVPHDGQLRFEVNKSYASASNLGYSFLGLGKNQQARNFALGFQINVKSYTPQSACGIIFRATADDWRSILISADGHLSISHQYQTTQRVLFDQIIPQFFSRQSQHNVVLTTDENTLSVYINGHPFATVPDDSQSTSAGIFALEVFNPLTNNIVTYCDYVNVWLWSFDPVTPTPTLTPTTTITPTATSTDVNTGG